MKTLLLISLILLGLNSATPLTFLSRLKLGSKLLPKVSQAVVAAILMSTIQPLTSAASSDRLIVNEKTGVSIFADKPIAPGDFGRRLDRLELTYFSKEDALAAAKVAKADKAAMEQRSDAKMAAMEQRSDAKMAAMEQRGILFTTALSGVLFLSAAYVNNKTVTQMKFEMEEARKLVKLDMEEARKQSKIDMDGLQLRTLAISLLLSISAYTSESTGYKFLVSLWKALVTCSDNGLSYLYML